MNKKLIVISVFLGVFILLFSSFVKNIVSKRGTHFVKKVDSGNRKTLLSLAKKCEKEGDYLKAREALRSFVRKFPDSKNIKEIKKDIEDLNVKILFSKSPTEDSFLYEIKSGDALAKIASKFNTTVELIKKANALKTNTIFPGRQLKINRAKFDIFVNKAENILILKKEDGSIIKTYIVSTGKDLRTPTGVFTIEEKLISPPWYKKGEGIVDSTSPEYELGSRWMGLSEPEYGIHGTNDASTIGKHITKGCVRMRNEDVEELYAIIPSGTEVTIVES